MIGRLLAGAALGGSLVTGSPVRAQTGDAAMRQIVDVIGNGDQAAYERFTAEYYAPATLAEYDAARQAALLARIYTDTGGFEIDRIAGEGTGWVQAELRARLTSIRYCATLSRAMADGREMITGFEVRDLHAAGPALEAPAPEELFETIDGLARVYVERGQFSGVILIEREGRTLFARAYGNASESLAIPMRLDTRLNTASIAKMFTAIAILQLVERGSLTLETRVGDVLPDFSNPAVRDRVTVRQLLTHTSGLGPADYYDHPRWPAMRDSLRSVTDYMSLAAETPFENPPGEYLYSNSGYIILGAMVERLSGGSFHDYVEEHIFDPAGMTRSIYAPGDVRALATVAALTNFHELPDHSYLYRLGAPIESGIAGGSTGGPQGGAWTTAADLLAFARALRAGRLVSPATFDLMTTPQTGPGAGAGGLVGETSAGLGIEIVRRNGHVFFGHTGGDFGIASFVFWYPETGYTTIMLTNRDPRAPRVLLNALRGLITRGTIGSAPPPPQGCAPPEQPAG